jgi:hypothetical protein
VPALNDVLVDLSFGGGLGAVLPDLISGLFIKDSSSSV